MTSNKLKIISVTLSAAALIALVTIAVCMAQPVQQTEEKAFLNPATSTATAPPEAPTIANDQTPKTNTPIVVDPVIVPLTPTIPSSDAAISSHAIDNIPLPANVTSSPPTSSRTSSATCAPPVPPLPAPASESTLSAFR